MEKFVKNSEFSDVVLNVGNVDFPAHKLVLAARSPVFAAMFKHDMQERKTNVVKIQDISSKAFAVGLEFLYTGAAVKVTKFAEKLLSFSDKYQLGQLKMRCLEIMANQLSIENACKYLYLANLHSADQLKKKTIAFINLHFLQVRKTTTWAGLICTDPNLLQEIHLDLFNRANTPPATSI